MMCNSYHVKISLTKNGKKLGCCTAEKIIKKTTQALIISNEFLSLFL